VDVPYLILTTPDSDLPSRIPRVVRFIDSVTVGRDRHSHIVTRGRQTHDRQFAILRVGEHYVIYDHDDLGGTFVKRAGQAPRRVSGGPLLLSDGVKILANRLTWVFRDTRGAVVAFFPDLDVSADGESSWALRPEEVCPGGRCPEPWWSAPAGAR
jgi:hypothetical protein